MRLRKYAEKEQYRNGDNKTETERAIERETHREINKERKEDVESLTRREK